MVLWLLGTLGYVMSEVEGGKPFSQVVNAAKSLGYTEPGNTMLQSSKLLKNYYLIFSILFIYK